MHSKVGLDHIFKTLQYFFFRLSTQTIFGLQHRGQYSVVFGLGEILSIFSITEYQMFRPLKVSR